MVHDLPQDIADPACIICQIGRHKSQSNFVNAFQMPHRQLSTNDCILGKASRTYDEGRMKIVDDLPHLSALKPFFPYFRSMNDVASRNRFTDIEGTTHNITGSRGGQQGGPLSFLLGTSIAVSVSCLRFQCDDMNGSVLVTSSVNVTPIDMF